ncbi:MAG: sigma-70 family RNA polymerase sigma factor [Anaerolineales bacterium]|nr:sigma-70 family RNA polymerase sigma factor [Anaerolineales bacterium]
MEPTNTELIQGCRRGDSAAWEALLERYQRLVYSIPRRAGLDEDRSAEVFQRVFSKLVEYLDRIEQPDRIGAWLATTARHEMWHFNQRESATQPLNVGDDSDDETTALPDDAPLPDEIILRLEEQHTVLEQVIGLMRTDASEDAPPAVITRARRLFQPRAVPAPTGRRRIAALLQFDSLQRPLALGVRSGQPAARQLLLKAESFDLDVRITPTRAAWQVAGQVLGLEASGQVELQGDTATVQADLNDLGEFSLPPPSRQAVTISCFTWPTSTWNCPLYI